MCWIICFDVISDGYSIILEHDETESFGFGIKQFGPGLFKIVNIKFRGPAYNNSRMRVGDILTGVDNMAITKSTNIRRISEMVMQSGDKIKLTLRSRPSKFGKQLDFSQINNQLAKNINKATN